MHACMHTYMRTYINPCVSLSLFSLSLSLSRSLSLSLSLALSLTHTHTLTRTTGAAAEGTALVFPGVIFCVFYVLNLVVWSHVAAHLRPPRPRRYLSCTGCR